MSFLSTFFPKKSNEPAGHFVTAQLNCRVRPVARGDHFEDPLTDTLVAAGVGAVTGGGTMMTKGPDGIAYVDLEIQLDHLCPENLQIIIDRLEELGAPKGSKLIVEDTGDETTFGKAEGLGLYLNGSDLPDAVYATGDVNHVIEECLRLIGNDAIFGYWESEKETALFFYGGDFAAMQAAIADFVASYPLCQKSRVVQIA